MCPESIHKIQTCILQCSSSTFLGISLWKGPTYANALSSQTSPRVPCEPVVQPIGPDRGTHPKLPSICHNHSTFFFFFTQYYY